MGRESSSCGFLDVLLAIRRILGTRGRAGGRRLRFEGVFAEGIDGRALKGKDVFGEHLFRQVIVVHDHPGVAHVAFHRAQGVEQVFHVVDATEEEPDRRSDASSTILHGWRPTQQLQPACVLGLAWTS